MNNILIVGSGITGSTIARILADNGYHITVVEQSQVLGGACTDAFENGYYIQKHGSHIFHTNNAGVWNFLSQFTRWLPYHHKVKALTQGSYIPVPYNLNSIKMLVADEFISTIQNILFEDNNYGTEFTLKELKEHKSQEIRDFAEHIEQNVFKGYSLKQWGKMPTEDVLNRLKAFRLSKDDRYFLDTYQGIPELGFTNMIYGMLNHDNIKVETGRVAGLNEFDKYDYVFYTGSIDGLFNYKFGRLPYRTCTFKYGVGTGRRIQQEGAVINYPNDYDYTRTHDYSWYIPHCEKACIATEYPEEYNGKGERYYPIQTEENQELYKSYLELAYHTYPRLAFAGRLGTYKYLNMDKAVEQAYEIVSKFLS